MTKFNKVIIFIVLIINSYAVSANATNIVHGAKYTVKSSSFLKSDRYNYQIKNVLPLTISTAWCEGKLDYGLNEWIKIKLKQQGEVNGFDFKILPGYAKSEKLFYANSRPKLLDVVVKNGKKIIQEKTLSIKDKPILHSIKFSFKPFLAQDLEFLIKIKDVFKGVKYKDTCISELQIHPQLMRQSLTDLQVYLEEEKAIEIETKYIKSNLQKANKGGMKEIVGLTRLSLGKYYSTAEGAEWLGEIYLTLLINNTENFIIALARQEVIIQQRVMENIINPVTDKYSNKYILKIINKSLSDKKLLGLAKKTALKIKRKLKDK